MSSRAPKMRVCWHPNQHQVLWSLMGAETRSEMLFLDPLPLPLAQSASGFDAGADPSRLDGNYGDVAAALAAAAAVAAAVRLAVRAR